MPETSMPETEAQIDLLAATPTKLAALTQDVSEGALDAAGPDEWSTRTILAHLRDDEFLVMRLRLERMLAEARPELAPFDEQAWAAGRWRGREALTELLEDFRLQRAASVAVLRRVEGEAWERPGFQPEYGELTLHTWLDHWLEHDETHLSQIARTLGAAAEGG